MKRWNSAVMIGAMILAPNVARAGDLLSCSAGVNPFAATTVPAISVCVNNQLHVFTGFSGTGKPYSLASVTRPLGTGASFTLSAIYNNDPFVSFTFSSTLVPGFGVVNFDVYLTTPVVGGGYTNASSAGTLSVTANGLNANALVTNGAYASYISGYANATNLNVNTGSGPCSAATTGAATTATTACNLPGASSSFAPISPSLLSSRLSYAQSAGSGSSTASWTGIVNLTSTTVPEPATLSLLFVGFLAVGAVRFRRGRS